MSDHTHDNRAQYMFASRCHGAGWLIRYGQRSAERDDVVWQQTMHHSHARALTAALAEALDVELHPAGTADRLAAMQPAATVDASAIPELAGLTAEDVAGVRAILQYVDRLNPHSLQDCGWVGQCFVRRFIEWENDVIRISARGRGVLAALQAQREREPEPIGYSDAALAGLLAGVGPFCEARLSAAGAAGLLTPDWEPTPIGLTVRAEVLRRLGITDDAAAESVEVASHDHS